MFGTIDPRDKQIRPFRVHKKFTFTNFSTGSGVYPIRGIAAGRHNFISSSAASQSFGTFNQLSASAGSYEKAYSLGSFYSVPTYYMVKHLYYQATGSTGQINQYHSFGGNQSQKERKIDSPYVGDRQKLHGQVNVLSIPRAYYGEQIQPKSIQISDFSGTGTFDIRDDGYGNLYDFANSSSYAAGTTGSVGNVFYSHGVLTITDTGSYKDVFMTSGSDGFSIDLKSTQTIYEYEYTVTAPQNTFNSTTNISATLDRSGSKTVPSSVPQPSMSIYFPPSDNPNGGLNSTGSYASQYTATEHYENIVTHSEFAPYVTTIGLYNDNNDLLAVGKLAHPIKNDPELAISFVIRFDV